jgi:fibronectin type 3 domain-containing protein
VIHSISKRCAADRSTQTVSQQTTSLSSRLTSCKRALFFFVVICFLGTSSLHAQWTQVWGGDFPGAAGTTYNHANWWNDVQPTAVWGDGTIQNTSDSLQNVYLDGNGDLVIAMTYNPNNAVPYTSARLTSTYNAGPYGRIDARIQNPSAVGMGAAFWALGADAYGPGTGPGSSAPSTAGGTPWPWCGELDMMELQAASNQHNGSTIHGGQTDGQTYYEYGGISSAVGLTGSATFDNGFHIFSTEWAPYSFTYLLDGVAYASVNLANVGATDQWEFTQPINFILSSGVGGNGGPPNGQGFPSNLVINYVNYSQWSAGAPAPVTGLTATATNSNAVALNWTASTTSDVTYDIYATTTSGTPPALANLVAQNVTTTSYVNTGLMPNTTYYYTVMAANYGGESSASTKTVTTQAPGNSTGMQLSAGGYAVGTYMNSNPPQPAVAGAAGPAPFVLGGATNYHWTAGPPAGLTPVNTSLVTDPAPQAIYNVERWGAAAWTIPGLNPLGGYNVRLHFVDFGSTAAGQREFNVLINGEQVLTNFDIFAQTGAISTAIAKEFYTTADESGIIEIQTTVGAANQPTIEAIEIIPTTGSNPVGAAPGTTTDLAINSGGTAESNFVADEDFNGGDTATSTATVTTNANSAPEAVYQSERYVPFTYALTGLVADAPYTVKMHFAETYWSGPADRIFSVNLNGKYVINDVDVFKTTGGENIAYDPQFTTNANEYGQIIVQFIYGGTDQPFINGIEAVQSGSPACSAIPSAPTNVVAAGSSSSVIGVSWNAVTPPAHCAISSYNVYGSTTSGFTPSSSTLLGSATGTTFSNTGLAASTTYFYVVEAVDTQGASGPSAQESGETLSGGNSCSAVPSAPGNLTATASSSSAIGLSWTAVTAPANCTISSYTVYGGTTANPTTVVASGVTGTTYSNTGLAASTTYYYLVKAVDMFGSSAASNQATNTTLAASSSSSIVSIDAGGAGVSNSGGGDNSFVADEDYTGGSTYSVTNTITIPAGVSATAAPVAVYQSARQGVTTYTIPGLTAGASYNVRLHFAELYFSAAGGRQFNVAINGTTVLTNFDIYATAGANYTAAVEQFTATANSSGQIVIAFTNGAKDQPMFNGIEVLGTSTACSAVPSAPTKLTATASSSSAIGLSWTAVTPPANCTISSYTVYGGTTANPTTVIATGVTGTTYSNTGLAASTTYYYLVKAVDADGTSAGSNQATTTTLASSGTDFIAINSGGPAASNLGGGDASFAADEDFAGGGTDTSGNTVVVAGVTNAAPMAVYQSERAGTFTYTLPGLVAGSQHTVLLHFAETYFTAAGKRQFNVSINGTTVLTNFDIYATAGANKALVEQFTATANSSGQIVIAYTNGNVDQPKSSGIEIR